MSKPISYLVFAIFHEGNNIATHSKHITVEKLDPEVVIADIAASGLGRENLYELYIYRSGETPDAAPELLQSWDTDDGLFGYEWSQPDSDGDLTTEEDELEC